jgi:hypothetical protein
LRKGRKSIKATSDDVAGLILVGLRRAAMAIDAY